MSTSTELQNAFQQHATLMIEDAREKAEEIEKLRKEFSTVNREHQDLKNENVNLKSENNHLKEELEQVSLKYAEEKEKLRVHNRNAAEEIKKALQQLDEARITITSQSPGCSEPFDNSTIIDLGFPVKMEIEETEIDYIIASVSRSLDVPSPVEKPASAENIDNGHSMGEKWVTPNHELTMQQEDICDDGHDTDSDSETNEDILKTLGLHPKTDLAIMNAPALPLPDTAENMSGKSDLPIRAKRRRVRRRTGCSDAGVHNGRTNEKIYRCKCNTEFYQKELLRQHLAGTTHRPGF